MSRFFLRLDGLLPVVCICSDDCGVNHKKVENDLVVVSHVFIVKFYIYIYIYIFIGVYPSIRYNTVVMCIGLGTKYICNIVWRAKMTSIRVKNSTHNPRAAIGWIGSLIWKHRVIQACINLYMHPQKHTQNSVCPVCVSVFTKFDWTKYGQLDPLEIYDWDLGLLPSGDVDIEDSLFHPVSPGQEIWMGTDMTYFFPMKVQTYTTQSLRYIYVSRYT